MSLAWERKDPDEEAEEGKAAEVERRLCCGIETGGLAAEREVNGKGEDRLDRVTGAKEVEDEDEGCLVPSNWLLIT